jgi:hypothetical protein
VFEDIRPRVTTDRLQDTNTLVRHARSRSSSRSRHTSGDIAISHARVYTDPSLLGGVLELAERFLRVLCWRRMYSTERFGARVASWKALESRLQRTKSPTRSTRSCDPRRNAPTTKSKDGTTSRTRWCPWRSASYRRTWNTTRNGYSHGRACWGSLATWAARLRLPGGVWRARRRRPSSRRGQKPSGRPPELAVIDFFAHIRNLRTETSPKMASDPTSDTRGGRTRHPLIPRSGPTRRLPSEQMANRMNFCRFSQSIPREESKTGLKTEIRHPQRENRTCPIQPTVVQMDRHAVSRVFPMSLPPFLF